MTSRGIFVEVHLWKKQNYTATWEWRRDVSGYMLFAGYNYGSGNIRRMISALKFTMLSGTGLCLIMLIPFVWLAPSFVRAFTSDRQIIETGVQFLHAQVWTIPFMAVQMTVMWTSQATGQAVRAMIVNLGRQCLFYIPFLYLFNYLWGLKGLLHAQMAAVYWQQRSHFWSAYRCCVACTRSLAWKGKQQCLNRHLYNT